MKRPRRENVFFNANGKVLAELLGEDPGVLDPKQLLKDPTGQLEHAFVPSQRQVEDYLLNRRKQELLDKYAIENAVQIKKSVQT